MAKISRNETPVSKDKDKTIRHDRRISRVFACCALSFSVMFERKMSSCVSTLDLQLPVLGACETFGKLSLEEQSWTLEVES